MWTVVPKTTEARIMDDSVQAREIIKNTQITPSVHLFYFTKLLFVTLLAHEVMSCTKM